MNCISFSISLKRVAIVFRKLIFLLFVLFVNSLAASELTIHDARDIIVDRAGVIDAVTGTRLSLLCERLRALTSAEVKALIVNTTQGEDIVSFSQRHFDLWKLGASGKDNGALIVLAVTDHHVRIHTGYGLESIMPDSWCGSLARSVANEQFKSGLYNKGMERIVRAVTFEIAQANHVELGQSDIERYYPPIDHLPTGKGLPYVLIFLVVIVVISILRRNGSTTSGWGSSYGGFGGSSAGGSFGGGSGGFSGGGGRSGGGGGGASW